MGIGQLAWPSRGAGVVAVGAVLRGVVSQRVSAVLTPLKPLSFSCHSSDRSPPPKRSLFSSPVNSESFGKGTYSSEQVLRARTLLHSCGVHGSGLSLSLSLSLSLCVCVCVCVCLTQRVHGPDDLRCSVHEQHNDRSHSTEDASLSCHSSYTHCINRRLLSTRLTLAVQGDSFVDRSSC
eukprot:COSAG03_NODE_3555_length_1950_cov_5.456510_2_plen_179_part_00